MDRIKEHGPLQQSVYAIHRRCTAAGGALEEKDAGAMYLSLNNDVYGVEDVDTLEGTEYDILKLIRDTARTAREYPKVYHAMGQQDIPLPGGDGD